MTYTTEELITILNSLPMAVLVVDEDRKVIRANRPTLQLVSKTLEDVLDKKGGEALNCPYVNDHADGCGHGPRCKGCELKNAVIFTLETGESIKRLEVSMKLIDNTLRCLLYTSPSPRDRTRSRMPSSA